MTALLLAYLANALWQPPLLLAATLLCARLLRPWGAAAQYRLWSGSLLLQCALPVASAFAPALPRMHPFAGRVPEDGTISILFSPATVLGSTALPTWVQTALLAAWALLTLFLAARFLLGLRTLARLRRSAAPVPLPPAAARAWTGACAALHLRPAPALAVSPRVTSPVTLGLSRPLILLPPGLLEELAEAELLTLFAHEGAHVRRRDFATNLLCQALLLPLGFHPALAITRLRLLEAREWACDAEAARALAGPHPFAASLLRLAARFAPAAGATQPAAHTVGLFTCNALERRIMHLAQHPTRPSRLGHLARLLAVSTLALGTTVTAVALHAPADHPPANAPHIAPTRVPSEVMAGQVLTRVPPTYPPAAKTAGIQGAVRLRATIGATGTIEQLRVLSGPPELCASAIESVRQWTYQPYTVKGTPVSVQTTITINYSLAQ